MPSAWVRALLFLTTVGYLTALIVLAPLDNPTVAVLALVPLVVAGGFFGLRAAVAFTVGLVIATYLVIELIGPGADVIFETYRGLPLLVFVMVGITIGRLHDLRTDLGHELEQRRLAESELRATQSQLEDLLDAKDELIASVGHELRTPLTAVLGFAEMLKIGNDTELTTTDRAEMVDFIAREAFDLSGIIDDLLVAARIEIGKLEVTKVPTALGAQIAQVVEGWDREAVTQISISGDNSKALADPARVRQIVRNLITNALRYGGDHINIKTGTNEQTAFIQVCDNGPGLPEDEWERIFDPYYGYHTEATQPGSVGLGLTVSRRLSELMEGNLTYQHHNGESILTLRLPKADNSS